MNWKKAVLRMLASGCLGCDQPGTCRVQLAVAVDQALVPVQPFQLHAGRRQAVEAHAAVY